MISNLTLDFSPSEPEPVSAPNEEDTFSYYRSRYIVPLEDSLNEFLESMKVTYSAMGISSENIRWQIRTFEEAVEKEHFDQLLGHLRRAFKFRGISNYNLEDQTETDTLLSYWDRSCAKSDQYRIEGLSKYAEKIDRFLGNRNVKSQPCGFVVTSEASLDSIWDDGRYSHHEVEYTRAVFNAIEAILEHKGIADEFNGNLILSTFRNPVESRKRFDFCKGVEVQTFKSSIKYFFSFEVMEALQLFVSEYLET